MAIGGFADNATVYSDHAENWNSKRYSITMLTGPARGRTFTLAGVQEMSGRGVAIENVTPVWAADGTGAPVKLTDGRENPNEVTMTIEKGTYDNIIRKYVIVGKGRNKRRYSFDWHAQSVDGAGNAISTETIHKCKTTGWDYNEPNDGTLHNIPFKFKPTYTD